MLFPHEDKYCSVPRCTKHPLHQDFGAGCVLCDIERQKMLTESVFSTAEPNRLQKREHILKHYKYWEIPDICMQLRTSVTGCSDPMPEQKERTLVRFLEVCLETWEPSLNKVCERFDNSVKELIEATLAEYKYYKGYDGR